MCGGITTRLCAQQHAKLKPCALKRAPPQSDPDTHDGTCARKRGQHSQPHPGTPHVAVANSPPAPPPSPRPPWDTLSKNEGTPNLLVPVEEEELLQGHQHEFQRRRERNSPGRRTPARSRKGGPGEGGGGGRGEGAIFSTPQPRSPKRASERLFTINTTTQKHQTNTTSTSHTHTTPTRNTHPKHNTYTNCKPEKKSTHRATSVFCSLPKSDIFLSQSALSPARASTAADRPRYHRCINTAWPREARAFSRWARSRLAFSRTSSRPSPPRVEAEPLGGRGRGEAQVGAS